MAISTLAAIALASPAASLAGPAASCKPFAEPCLLPFPNDLFTKRDASSITGRRLDLPQNAMPKNSAGVPIQVGPYDRADGFDPGSEIVARVPGLDTPRALANTDPARLQRIGQYKAHRAPIVLINARTGKRQPIWAELDSNAPDAADTTLLIHPAKNLVEGRRYIVALRRLKDAGGHALKAPRWFELLRDGKPLPQAERSQRGRYDSIFKTLKRKTNVSRKRLYMAWDYTVESRQSLTRSMLAIRDDAFRQLGDTNLSDGTVSGSAPTFQVTSSQDFTPAENANLQREVKGNFVVPCYLQTPACGEEGDFNYASGDPDSKPVQLPGNQAVANFDCIIPRSASAARPARTSLYGHGLLGSASEVKAGNVQAMANGHNFMFCATDWWGLSTQDIPTDIAALEDLNTFPAAIARLQQGVLNTLYLSRLMANPQGFASSVAFQGAGQPLFRTPRTYYDGNSQGGIMGGMATAVAPDFRRAVLGVPGMNYGGLLLQRSTDFGAYSTFLYGDAGGGYPDPSTHPLLLDLMEQLWTRGEAEGYARQMTSHPLPDTPTHKVLMHVAYGDHQVSQYSAAAEARTIGARVYSPALDPARSRDAHLFYGVKPIPSLPYRGSGIVIWDSGPSLVDPPPFTNTPPSGSTHDPHGDPRATAAAQQQKSDFLRVRGHVVDVCGGAPCHTDAYVP